MKRLSRENAVGTEYTWVEGYVLKKTSENKCTRKELHKDAWITCLREEPKKH